MVRIDTLKCLLSVATVILLVSACERAAQDPAPAAATPATTTPAPAPATAPAARAPAQVRDDVPLPLTKLLGRPVDEVQALLGEHEGKGMVRSSCFRFAPARIHFTCRYALQSYADRTGNFRSVRVAYEDGLVSAVAFDGWKHGDGPFTPDALLTAIGLTLPAPGKAQQPAEGVQLWSWYNGRAQLLIDGKQHRVEVSVVGDDWSRSRVEVTMNHPLTPEQEARVVPVGGKAPDEPAMSSGPAAPAAPSAPSAPAASAPSAPAEPAR